MVSSLTIYQMTSYASYWLGSMYVVRAPVSGALFVLLYW
jgi:hypothetical protein